MIFVLLFLAFIFVLYGCKKSPEPKIPEPPKIYGLTIMNNTGCFYSLEINNKGGQYVGGVSVLACNGGYYYASLTEGSYVVVWENIKSPYTQQTCQYNSVKKSKTIDLDSNDKIYLD